MTTLDTMIPVKPTQLHHVLVNCLRGGEPVCIVGGSGIGKSDIVAQAVRAAFPTPVGRMVPTGVAFLDDLGQASAAVQAFPTPVNASTAGGADFLILHPVTSDPTDYKGLPVMTVNGAEFSAYGDLRLMMTATRPLVVFLDDLGQASAAVQAAVMQLVLNRAVNGCRISDFVTFVAATNDRSHRAGVSGLLDPLKKRFLMLLLLPDFVEWSVWAAANNIDARVIAYLNLVVPKSATYFCNDEPTPDMSVNASARGWARVSRQLKLGHRPDVLPAVFGGCVGKQAGTEFAAFLRIYDSMVNPDTVLASPHTAPIPSEPSSLWALTTALAYKVTTNNVGAYCAYMMRVLNAGKREFVAVSLRLMTSRDPALQGNRDWIDAATGPLGRLLMGSK